MTRFEPKKRRAGLARLFSVVAAVALLLVPAAARAQIVGETVTGSVTLTASAGYVSIADGGAIYSWGYSTGSQMQLPGPTLIVTAGDDGDGEPQERPACGRGQRLDRLPGAHGHDDHGRRPGSPDAGGHARRLRHLHLHGQRARDLSLPQRDAAGSAGGDGPLRSADRAAVSACSRLHELRLQPLGDLLRPRVPVPAERDRHRHPPRSGTAGLGSGPHPCRHRAVPFGVLAPQRARGARHDGRGGRRAAADPALQLPPAHAPRRTAAAPGRGREPRVAPLPHSREPQPSFSPATAG